MKSSKAWTKTTAKQNYGKKKCNGKKKIMVKFGKIHDCQMASDFALTFQ